MTSFHRLRLCWHNVISVEGCSWRCCYEFATFLTVQSPAPYFDVAFVVMSNLSKLNTFAWSCEVPFLVCSPFWLPYFLAAWSKVGGPMPQHTSASGYLGNIRQWYKCNTWRAGYEWDYSWTITPSLRQWLSIGNEPRLTHEDTTDLEKLRIHYQLPSQASRAWHSWGICVRNFSQ